MVIKGRYSQTFRRDFVWKHYAQEFAKKVKAKNNAKPRSLRDRLSIKILPLARVISTAEWHESHVVGWVVAWSYLPPKRSRR